MINKEREATSAAGRSVPNSANRTDDPPPPYSLYKPSMAAEPPPPPLEPPALTSEQPPAVITEVIPGPGPQTENTSNYHLTSGESIKAACCIVLCWFWIPFAFCIDCCARTYPQLRPKRYR